MSVSARIMSRKLPIIFRRPAVLIPLAVFLSIEICTLGIFIVREYDYWSATEANDAEGIRIEIVSSAFTGGIWPFVINWCDSERYTDLVVDVDWTKIRSIHKVESRNISVNYPDGTREITDSNYVRTLSVDEVPARDHGGKRILHLENVRASYTSFTSEIELTLVSGSGMKAKHLIRTTHTRGKVHWWVGTGWYYFSSI